MEKSSAAYIFQ